MVFWSFLSRFNYFFFFFFFFQAEDGIRDADVTGVQTCALPILTFNNDTRYGRSTMQFGVFTIGDITQDPTDGTTPTENERIRNTIAIARHAEDRKSVV